jgi:hypothetical protein
VYLRVGLDGVGWDAYRETILGHEVVCFQYPYVGLPGLNAENYINQDNWLGVALTALMRVPAERRAELARQAWRRLIQCPLNDYQRHLLFECVDIYTPLDPVERQAIETALLTDPDVGVRAMSMGLMEKWRQQGRQEGRQEGQRETVLKILTAQFGPLSANATERVNALSGEDLDKLCVALATAKTLADLGLAAPQT